MVWDQIGAVHWSDKYISDPVQHHHRPGKLQSTGPQWTGSPMRDNKGPKTQQRSSRGTIPAIIRLLYVDRASKVDQGSMDLLPDNTL